MPCLFSIPKRVTGLHRAVRELANALSQPPKRRAPATPRASGVPRDVTGKQTLRESALHEFANANAIDRSGARPKADPRPFLVTIHRLPVSPSPRSPPSPRTVNPPTSGEATPTSPVRAKPTRKMTTQRENVDRDGRRVTRIKYRTSHTTRACARAKRASFYDTVFLGNAVKARHRTVADGRTAARSRFRRRAGPDAAGHRIWFSCRR